MLTESKNVEKKCACSFLVSHYDHLNTMPEKNKTTNMCGTANCIRSHCLWTHITHKLCSNGFLILFLLPQENTFNTNQAY